MCWSGGSGPASTGWSCPDSCVLLAVVGGHSTRSGRPASQPPFTNLSCAAAHTAMVTAERLQRFTRTERAAHWLVVAMFAAILLSGTQMPHRWDADQPVVDVHVGAAAILVAGMALLLWRADRRSLLATGVQLATTEPGDGDW